MQGGGVLWVTPNFFYELHFCEKMKNEAKPRLRGEQGRDEMSCKYACKFDAVAMQSLVSEITLLFLISILELITKIILTYKCNFSCRNQIKLLKDLLEVLQRISIFAKTGLSMDLKTTEV